MEENRNNRAVERRMKDALKNDRARIQVGRISHFGLLEMSRQRLRPGLLEGTMKTCAHCEGRGIVRSIPSCGLGVLRQIEDYLQKGKAENLTVKTPREVAFYLLNDKRDSLLEIEQQYGISIFLVPGDDVKGSTALIERAPEREKIKRRSLVATPVNMESAFNDEPEIIEEDVVEEDMGEDVASEEAGGEPQAEANGEARRDGGRKRRRRGRRGGKREDFAPGSNGSAAPMQTEGSAEEGASEIATEAEPSHNIEQVEVEGSTPAAEGERSEGRERSGNRGRKRGRFGRDRGPRQDRGGEDRPPPHERGPRPEREAVMAAAPAPVAIHIPEVMADPEPRKWQPPAPTIAAEPAARKGGWWSKK